MPLIDRSILKKGLLATIGYLLSPLSWWNDPYVNLPIAYGLACVAGLIDRQIFAPALVIFYWLTNIAGLVMLHKGVTPANADGSSKSFWQRIKTDLIISLIYTAVIVLLLRFGLLKLPQEYFCQYP